MDYFNGLLSMDYYEKLEDPEYKISLSNFKWIKTAQLTNDMERANFKTNYKKWFGSEWKTHWRTYKLDLLWQSTKRKHQEITKKNYKDMHNNDVGIIINNIDNMNICD
jgi:hypothetical protein